MELASSHYLNKNAQQNSVFTPQKARALIVYLQSKSQGKEEQLFLKNEVYHDTTIFQVVKVHIYGTVLILNTVHHHSCKNEHKQRPMWAVQT